VMTIPFILFLLFVPAVRNDKELRRFAGFSLTALATGMLIVGLKIYFPAGTRHGIWVLPFVIPVIGWMTANAISELNTAIAKKMSMPSVSILLLTLAIVGLSAYDAGKRFT